MVMKLTKIKGLGTKRLLLASLLLISSASFAAPAMNPVFQEVTAPGCAACKDLAKNLNDPRVQARLSRFAFVKLSPAQKAVTAVPTVTVFDSHHKVVFTHTGTMSVNDLVRLLDSVR